MSQNEANQLIAYYRKLYNKGVISKHEYNSHVTRINNQVREGGTK